MVETSSEIKLRKCTKCQKEYPATLEYFGKEKNTKLGLTSICKFCKKKKYESNIEENRENRRNYYKVHKEELIKKATEYNVTHEDDRKIYLKLWRIKNQQKIKEYRLLHNDQLVRNKKEYRMNNRGLTSTYKRRYKEQNKEKVLSYQRDYYSRNKDIFRIDRIRRKSNAKGLISAFLRVDWEFCKSFFGNSCAYCGEKVQLLTQDHVIPITKGGNYTKDNIFPACPNCNSKKHNKDFEKWYPNCEFFSVERLNRIIHYKQQFIVKSEHTYITERNITGIATERNGITEH
mgnify:CR=1 FL=1